jgi:hypothetical protein
MKTRAVGLLFSLIAVVAVAEPAGAAGVNSALKAIVIHRSDLGADYEKVFAGAASQPVWDNGLVLHMNLWRIHGYLGDWASRFGHDTLAAKHQMDGQVLSNVDAYSSAANAHWAFLRERKVYRTAPSVAVTPVGDEFAAFGSPGQWTAITFRRGRYLALVVGTDRDHLPSRVLSLALLMDGRARIR